MDIFVTGLHFRIWTCLSSTEVVIQGAMRVNSRKLAAE